MKRKLLLLPIVGLILGAVAIATEIKITDFSPLGQQLSGTVVHCIKLAVDTQESSLITSITSYTNGYIGALTTKKTAVLAAWDKTSKKDIKSSLLQALKTYKSTMHSLNTTLKISKKTIYSTYKTDVKACKGLELQSLVDIHTQED